MRRKIITDLLDLLGIALVGAGLLGYDWRISAIFAGMAIMVASKLNA